MKASPRVASVLNNRLPIIGLKIKWLIALVGVPLGLWGGVAFGE